MEVVLLDRRGSLGGGAALFAANLVFGGFGSFDIFYVCIKEENIVFMISRLVSEREIAGNSLGDAVTWTGFTFPRSHRLAEPSSTSSDIYSKRATVIQCSHVDFSLAAHGCGPAKKRGR